MLVDSLGTWVGGAPGFAVDVAGLCAGPDPPRRRRRRRQRRGRARRAPERRRPGAGSARPSGRSTPRSPRWPIRPGWSWLGDSSTCAARLGRPVSERSSVEGLRAAVGFLTPLGGASTPDAEGAAAGSRLSGRVSAPPSVACGGWRGGPGRRAGRGRRGRGRGPGAHRHAALRRTVRLRRRAAAAPRPRAAPGGDGRARRRRVRRRAPWASSLLLVRWVALASIRPAPLLLAALWAASRTCMAVTVATVRRTPGPAAWPGAFRSPAGATGAVPLAVGGAAAAAHHGRALASAGRTGRRGRHRGRGRRRGVCGPAAPRRVHRRRARRGRAWWERRSGCSSPVSGGERRPMVSGARW